MGEKLDLKKENKELYTGKDGEIKEVFCKKAFYITIDGEGDPNTNEKYKMAIGALYKVAYSLKFIYKNRNLDFVVMPLSGLWWGVNSEENKEEWKWRAMIEIPNYVEEDDIEVAKEEAYVKSKNEVIKEVLYREMNENRCFQLLHIGPYNKEKEKISALHRIIKEKGYSMRGKHHEIYLNDARKTEENSLKTIIRQPVYKEEEEILNFEEESREFFDRLRNNKVMVLSTADGERVSSRSMSIIIYSRKFYFQTDKEFRKVKDINKNRNVALCVDNIQVEGKIGKIGSIYDEYFKDFKKLYKENYSGSYKTYSKLMENKVFEIIPEIISLYEYEGKNVYRKFINFNRKVAYRRLYLSY
ncbi:GyrI-like domain-containing protein [Clostridium sp. HBUAS56017]|uniref:GyrI-like domain-containing protein n=1 Tax=Clostridium sp. HBUAS56017 TaxID=2571128 RepID=UPI00163DB5E2|nr:GyrI-like domain-containing protein [Clostridium sp. HBUAS56017]